MTGRITDCVLTAGVFGLSVGAAMLLGLFGYPKRKNQLPFRTAFLALLAVQTALVLLLRDTENQKLAAELCLMGGVMGLGYLHLHPHKKLTFAWSGLMFCAVFDYLAFVILSFLPVQTYRAELIVYAVLYGAAVMTIVAFRRFSMIRLRQEYLEETPPVLCISFFLAQYLAYYAHTLTDTAANKVVTTVLQIISVVLFAGSVIYLFSRFAALAMRQREDALRHTLETKRYEELIEKNRDVRAFRHDYKNNLLALHSLLEAGRTDEAAEYVRSLSDTIEQTRSAYMTGNLLADAILTDKAQNAKQRGIDVVFRGIVPSAGVEDRDLCVILANALDNAVEGCSGCAPFFLRPDMPIPSL